MAPNPPSSAGDTMQFYKYQPSATSYYYFPAITLTSELWHLHNFYSPHGRLDKLYWRLLPRRYWLERNCQIVTEEKLDFPYPQILSTEKKGSFMSFRVSDPGTKNEKIVILGFDPLTRIPFFAKFVQQPMSMLSVANEINILKELADSGLVPALMEYAIKADYIWLKTAYVLGGTVKNRDIYRLLMRLLKGRKINNILSQNITQLAITISRLRTPELREDGLIYVFAHGDFLPQNVLQDRGKLQLIDWETAGYYPLGYDIFTWIFQPGFTMSNQNWRQVLSRNHRWLKTYFDSFDITNYIPYLTAFATRYISYLTTLFPNQYAIDNCNNLLEFSIDQADFNAHRF